MASSGIGLWFDPQIKHASYGAVAPRPKPISSKSVLPALRGIGEILAHRYLPASDHRSENVSLASACGASEASTLTGG